MGRNEENWAWMQVFDFKNMRLFGWEINFAVKVTSVGSGSDAAVSIVALKQEVSGAPWIFYVWSFKSVVFFDPLFLAIINQPSQGASLCKVKTFYY